MLLDAGGCFRWSEMFPISVLLVARPSQNNRGWLLLLFSYANRKGGAGAESVDCSVAVHITFLFPPYFFGPNQRRRRWRHSNGARLIRARRK